MKVADPSVWSAPTVSWAKPAYGINVKIHVQEHVACPPFAQFRITFQFVTVLKEPPEMRLELVNLYRSLKVTANFIHHFALVKCVLSDLSLVERKFLPCIVYPIYVECPTSFFCVCGTCNYRLCQISLSWSVILSIIDTLSQVTRVNLNWIVPKIRVLRLFFLFNTSGVFNHVFLNLEPEHRDPCVPSPCGPNTKCQVNHDIAVCECLPGFEGSPTTSGCHPECVINADCPRNKACMNNKCVDPCPGVCGYKAICQTLNHSPVCSCPPPLIGDPFYECKEAPGEWKTF